MFRAWLSTQHICVGSHVSDFNDPFQICVYYHQMLSFSAFFPKSYLFPNRSGFYRNKGDVPQTTSAFCFPHAARVHAQEWTPSLRSKPSKICNFVTTSTNVHHENASSRRELPLGVRLFEDIFALERLLCSVRPLVRISPKIFCARTPPPFLS